jgi:predicted nucleic acid-binding protein
MTSLVIYLDTNVIMDFLLGRNSSAFDLLKKVVSCKYFVLISDVVCEELNYQGLSAESSMFVNILKTAKKVNIVKASIEDKKEAKKILLNYSTHYNDALHKVISTRCEAKYFVTSNIRDFICFEDLQIKKPDEL